MKRLILVSLVMFCGCLPATQTEVQDLTTAVSAIVPAVRQVIAASSEDTKEEIEIVLSRVEQVNEQVATADDPIDAIEEGWNASEAWNPYYGYGVLGIALLRLFQGKKRTETALEEVVIGIEDSKKGVQLRDALNASESVVTKNMVKKILS